MTTTPTKKHPGGRPPKFLEPRRPVTVTLPDRTLTYLSSVNRDRAKAIAQLADDAAGRLALHPAVDVVVVAPETAVILVKPTPALKRIKLLRLVEVSPGRCLLTIPPGTPVDTLEIALLDAFEDLPESQVEDRNLLAELRRMIGGLRRNRRMTKAEILFIRP